jgi:Protein of unknown function (DUF4238)
VAKDHFVPQLYLRQFAMMNVPRLINVARICPYRFFTAAQIKGQCQENNFYENHAALNRLILTREQGYAPLLRNVVATKDFTADQAEILKLLAVDLHTRTKKAAEYSKLLPRHLACDALQGAIDRGELPPVPDGKKLKDVIDFTGAPGNTMRFAGMCMLELNTTDCKLLVATGTDFFITSDNPVAMLNQFCAHLQDEAGVTGFSKAGLQLALPISPQLCFFVYDPKVYKVGNRRDRTVPISGPDTELVNSLQVQSAEECLYFHNANREPEVKRLVERYSSLRVPIQDSLREIKRGAESLLHMRHPAARIRNPWQFCRLKKHISVQPGDRRDPVVTYLIDKLMDDFDANPNGGDIKSRVARIISAHPEQAL